MLYSIFSISVLSKPVAVWGSQVSPVLERQIPSFLSSGMTVENDLADYALLKTHCQSTVFVFRHVLTVKSRYHENLRLCVTLWQKKQRCLWHLIWRSYYCSTSEHKASTGASNTSGTDSKLPWLQVCLLAAPLALMSKASYLHQQFRNDNGVNIFLT